MLTTAGTEVLTVLPALITLASVASVGGAILAVSLFAGVSLLLLLGVIKGNRFGRWFTRISRETDWDHLNRLTNALILAAMAGVLIGGASLATAGIVGLVGVAVTYPIVSWASAARIRRHLDDD